jgi:divalent metal cation (Fe/Co/Zn/Cd) transporter
MSPHVSSTVVVLKTLTLILGGSITYYAFKAYQRTGSQALRALATGFGVITLGAIAAGIVDQLLPFLGPSVALIVESLFTTLGFGVILYSLFIE